MSATDMGTKRRTRLATARLYLVCDSHPGGRALTDVLRNAIAGGVDIVQLRDKRLGDEKLLEVAHTARNLCEQLGALFIVNDRPEVALEVGADGVHVGQEDMPVAQARDLVGPEMLIGLSTHTEAEIDAAGESDAVEHADGDDRLDRVAAAAARSQVIENVRVEVDYIGVGPVYSTPTKPDRPPVGIELVRYAAEHACVPFFAIGSIHASNIASVLAAGARRVAVVRAVADAADPESEARRLHALLEGAT